MHEQYVQLYNAVGVPYEVIRAFLTGRSLPVLDAPRRIGVDWLSEGTAHLEFDIARAHLVKEVCFRVADYSDVSGPLPMGRVQLSWEPLDHTDIYPIVSADLEIEPIDHERTMVSLLASYDPPLGRIGAVVDRVAMHRIAESALRRFFERLVSEIKANAKATSA
ncbi:MAG: hypothetical protein ABFR89_01990 [Actinomycetota bacterium]